MRFVQFTPHLPSKIKAIVLLSLLSLSVSTPASAALLAFYDFDDATANNRASVLYNGTFSATAPTFTAAGYEGGAFDFNGTNNFIQLNGLNINPGTLPQLTMGAWVNTDVITGRRAALTHDNGAFDRTIGIDERNNGGVDGYAGFGGDLGVVQGGVNAVAGQWVFMALRSNSATGALTLDVDTSRVSVGSADFNSGLTSALIGANTSFNEYWNGRIDNVFFFDTVLSDAEIDTIRTGGAAAILPVTVPEAGTFPLIAAGLIGVIGIIARRRTIAA